MPAALPLRLRAPCLKWLPREVPRARTASRLAESQRPYSRLAKEESEADAAASEEQKHPPKATCSVPKPSKTPSLLEELFPEEAQKRSATARGRAIPRLDVRAAVPKTPVHGGEDEKRDSWGNDASAESARGKRPNGQKPRPTPAALPVDRTKQQVTGVLMLRNASRSLIEDDFTRLIPQGLHIEGWPLDQADIVKVVPGRDTSTLERLNWYLILFSSRESMNAYRKHVQRLHSLAGQHVPSGLTSPVPPPPGYMSQGQDVDALVQSYTLVPPTQRLRLLPLPDEKPPSMTQVVDNRGYPDIVDGPVQEPFKVMVRFDGPQLSLQLMKRLMIRVERERRVPWDQEFAELKYAVWHPRGKNISPLDPRSTLDADGEDHGTRGKRAEGPAGEARRPRRRPKAAYMIGFHDEDKAQTFVRYWHRRAAQFEDDFTYENDDVAPVLEAEVLW